MTLAVNGSVRSVLSKLWTMDTILLRNYYLLAPHTSAGDFKVPVSTITKVMSTGGQQGFDRLLRIKDKVHIS